MILLTANHSMKGEISWAQVLKKERLPSYFPMVTLTNVDRIIEREYREECVDCLIEIILDLENYLGISRRCIP